MIVAEGDDREGNGPSEKEEDEHENASFCCSVEIVETAAGEETFGNVFAESDVKCWNYGEKCTVDPDKEYHQSGSNSCYRSERVQRIDDDKISVNGDGSECCNRCNSGESAEEAVQATTLRREMKIIFF